MLVGIVSRAFLSVREANWNLVDLDRHSLKNNTTNIFLISPNFFFFRLLFAPICSILYYNIIYFVLVIYTFNKIRILVTILLYD